jgi:RimJ/RimL family protein N-acetyltransferase
MPRCALMLKSGRPDGAVQTAQTWLGRPVAGVCDTASVSEPLNDIPAVHWPLFGLRLRCDDVLLRPVRERDLRRLAALQPPDYEHDPSAEVFPGESLAEHRRRLVYQGYWRSLGTWSPSSWCLDLAVEHEGALVGVQSLEADDFLDLRTVDSGSWPVDSARGRGIGIAMRTAVLALAFDHLGALAAVTSARTENAASLGVSRHVGYRDNGVSLNRSGHGLVELAHMRLTAEEWRASGAGSRVTVSGLDSCLPWFGVSFQV